MLFKATFVLAAASLLMACQHDPVKAPGAGMPDPLFADEYPQIVVTDQIADYMGFHRPVVDVQPGKPMSVVVPARLINDYAINVQYRFIFMDSAGRPIEPVMGFTYMRMPGRVQQFMRGAALDTNAVDWRLEIRSAR